MKKKLIAIDTIVIGKASVEPGKPFEAEADQAASLVKCGAARESEPAPAVAAAEAPAAGGGNQNQAGGEQAGSGKK